MHETSSLYKQIISSENHWKETSIAIGEQGRLITEDGDTLTFGGTSILVARSGADAGYQENMLMEVSVNNQIFSNNKPEVGCCIAGEIDVKMLRPAGDIPRMAQIVPYVRVCNESGQSEWIQKGVYFVDTRETNEDAQIETLTMHGYDAMLKSEQDYTGDGLSWPAKDKAVVLNIAGLMGVSVEAETLEKINMGYEIQLPVSYTCREILSYIAASYAGSFIMNDIGELKLVQFCAIPRETRLLIDNVGYAITFGGDRILV